MNALSGKVKWYNADKGYGFIQVDGREKDIFFHAKQWNSSGITGLPIEGELLNFVVDQGPKGDFATTISRNGAA